MYFGAKFFGSRYFGAHFFAGTGPVTPPVPHVTVGGGSYRPARREYPAFRDAKARGARFGLVLSFHGGKPSTSSAILGAAFELSSQFTPRRAEKSSPAPLGILTPGRAIGDIFGLSEDEFQHLLDLA